MKDLAESFPEADPSCLSDTARAYFGSTLDDGFFYEGNLLEPISATIVSKSDYNKLDSTSSIPVDATLEDLVKEVYGEPRDFIPEAVDHFLRNAPSGLPGTWNSSLNAFTFTLALQSVPEDVVEDIVKFLAPEPLSKSDITTLSRSYRDGEKNRE